MLQEQFDQNGIDIGRCLWKLLAIVCVPGFLGTQSRCRHILQSAAGKLGAMSLAKDDNVW